MERLSPQLVFGTGSRARTKRSNQAKVFEPARSAVSVNEIRNLAAQAPPSALGRCDFRLGHCSLVSIGLLTLPPSSIPIDPVNRLSNSLQQRVISHAGPYSARTPWPAPEHHHATSTALVVMGTLEIAVSMSLACRSK